MPRAVGVDLSEKLITEARSRLASTGCEFDVANAGSLPYRDGEFDAVRVDRSLQHMTDPAKVISEMTRVRAQAAWFFRGTRLGTFIIGTPHSPTTKRVQERWAESFCNPWIGRNLYALMTDAGVVSLQLEAHWLFTQGFAASDLVFDIAATSEKLSGEDPSVLMWLDAYRKSEALAGVMLIICSGQKA